jgi:hypothetical protein
MRTLFLRLILSGLLAIMAGGASAENGSMPAAAPPAAIAVTPEQARRTLEVLEDEGKRARTIELLRKVPARRRNLRRKQRRRAPTRRRRI